MENPKADHLRYFIGIGSELLRLDKNFRYNLVSGIGWRTGLLCGCVLRKGYFNKHFMV